MIPSTQNITKALMALSEKHGQEKAVLAMKSFLTKTHLLPLLPAVIAILKKKSLEEQKENTITITSATNIDESTVDRISDIAHRNTGSVPTVVSLMVDKNLVGGFVAVYKGVVFDGSVDTMLSSLLTKK